MHCFLAACSRNGIPVRIIRNVITPFIFHLQDTKHLLMIFPLYDNIRTTLLISIQQLNLHVLINYKLLLYGNTMLTPRYQPFNTGTPVHILN